MDVVPKKAVKYQSEFDAFNQFFGDLIDPVNTLIVSYLSQRGDAFNTKVQASLIVVLKAYSELCAVGVKDSVMP